MKNIFLVFFYLTSLGVMAQPTITQSDLPVAGLVFTMGTDSAYTGSIPPAGANQNWNLASLRNLLTDTTGFMSAAGTPFTATFNSSNLAAYDDETNTYTYFTSNANGFFIDGFGNASLNYHLIPGQCYMPVPFTFGNQFTNVARNSVDSVYTDTTGTTYNLRNIINITSVFDADGYGNLTLPNATINNTLRVKVTETTYDSLYTIAGPFQYLLSSSASQDTYYRWFRHGNQASYVLGIKADSLGTTANYTEYFLASILLNVGMPEPLNAILPAPNPANEVISIAGWEYPEDGIATLFSSTGQIIGHYPFSATLSIKLDISDLKNGLYYVTLHGTKGARNLKFIVSH